MYGSDFAWHQGVEQRVLVFIVKDLGEQWFLLVEVVLVNSAMEGDGITVTFKENHGLFLKMRVTVNMCEWLKCLWL